MNRETVTWQRDSGSLLREIDEELIWPSSGPLLLSKIHSFIDKVCHHKEFCSIAKTLENAKKKILTKVIK